MHRKFGLIALVTAIAIGMSVAPPTTAAPANVAGMVVFLDPGHNAINDGNSRQVPTGRGGTKDCQTSGTTTASGYPEHAFTWDTTLRIRAGLTALGVRSAMSRETTTAQAPVWTPEPRWPTTSPRPP